MKKTLIILSMMLISTWMNAQTLYEPLQQFADVCFQEKKAIQIENPDYNQQYKQLYDCLKAFNCIPMRDGSKILHPSNTCVDELKEGHILFLPSFVAEYMVNKIPNPSTPSIPYVDNETRRSAAGEADTISIFYTNTMLCPNAIETFSYRVSAGEQQLIAIAEDDTPLVVEITSDKGTSVSAGMKDGMVKLNWNEDNPSKILVKVNNPTNKYVSFVIAVH